jgi:hypothetical protein
MKKVHYIGGGNGKDKRKGLSMEKPWTVPCSLASCGVDLGKHGPGNRGTRIFFIYYFEGSHGPPAGWPV